MSRGYGKIERHVLAEFSEPHCPSKTIDNLAFALSQNIPGSSPVNLLADSPAARSLRSSVRRAVRNLARQGLIEPSPRLGRGSPQKFWQIADAENFKAAFREAIEVTRKTQQERQQAKTEREQSSRRRQKDIERQYRNRQRKGARCKRALRSGLAGGEAERIPQPRILKANDFKEITRKYCPRDFDKKTHDVLNRDLFLAISEYQFRQGYPTALTPAQFRKQFDDLHSALKRLKAKLPPVQRSNYLFNYIRKRGEAYAAAHGPHPGVDPVKLPALSPAFGLGDEPPDFNSAKRLRELIESVHQVSCWMEAYSEDGVPKSGLSRLEKIYGVTHSPELWLIGKQLPKIFANYLAPLEGRPAREGGSRCNRFVVDVLKSAEIKTSKNKTYDVDTVKKYRRRARKTEGFELTGDKLD